MYGRTLIEGIQKPGEAIYIPHGLTHSVLNIRDNVAVTENHLFVDSLPGKQIVKKLEHKLLTHYL